MSSHKDHHWEPFLNEGNDEESEIEKFQSADTTQQSSAESNIKELNTDENKREEEAILEADSDKG